MVLTLTIKQSDDMDFWDPDKEEFVYYPDTTINLNHCLLAISKWEEIWKRPFIHPPYSTRKMSEEEIISYIRCMSDEPIPDYVIQCMTPSDIRKITNYINDTKTPVPFLSLL